MSASGQERNLFIFRDLVEAQRGGFIALSSLIDSPHFTPRQHPSITILSGNRTRELDQKDMGSVVNPLPTSARSEMPIDTTGIGFGWLKNNRATIWVELDSDNPTFAREQLTFKQRVGKITRRTISPQNPHASLGTFEPFVDPEPYIELLTDNLMPNLTFAPLRTFPEGLIEPERQKPNAGFLATLRQTLPSPGNQ